MTVNNPKIFLDNIVLSIQQFGGARTYWLELLKRFIAKPEVGVICQKGQNDRFEDIEGNIFGQFDNRNKFNLERTFAPTILRYLPLTKRLPKKSIYHNSYYRTSFQKDIVNIFTIHDFAHKKGFASKFPRNLIHITLTSIGLKNADGIIAISESTKRDLIEYYPNIPEKKIKVIYHGVNEDFFPISKSAGLKFKSNLLLNDPFVLFVGKRGEYKNFSLVLEAMMNIANINLVAVGGEDMNDEEIKRLETQLPGRFFYYKGLDNSELNLLYNYAFALIYPSLFEGFGFPVLEAMRAGCPVITTKLSSIPEVGGDAAVYMENSSQSLIDCIDRLRSDMDRNFIIQKGFEQSKKFSWDKCAKETFQFYSDIYNMKYGV